MPEIGELCKEQAKKQRCEREGQREDPRDASIQIRLMPRADATSYLAVEAALDAGMDSKGSICPVRDIAHTQEIQDQCSALGISKKLTMIAAIYGRAEDLKSRQKRAVEVMVPVYGQIALVRRLAACISGNAPDVGAKRSLKKIDDIEFPDKPMETIRVAIVAPFAPEDLRPTVIRELALSIKMLGRI